MVFIEVSNNNYGREVATMKFQQKKSIILKLWGYVCLAINCFIISIFLAEKVSGFLGSGGILSILIIGYGAVKTQADKAKNDLSGTSVAIEYICVYLLTFLAAFKVMSYLSSFSLLIVLAISSLIEFIIFLFITYYHTIRHFFLKYKECHIDRVKLEDNTPS